MENNKSFFTVKDNLETLLAAFPDLRFNYNKLCATYWQMFDGVIDMDDIENATSTETITRVVRKLITNGTIGVRYDEMIGRQKKATEFKSELSKLV